jgi:hypothetical protein
MADMVTKDPLLGPEVRQFARRVGVFFTISVAILGLLQFLGGFPSAESLVWSPDVKNPYVAGARLTFILGWLIMLWWVWVGGGADLLLKYRGLLIGIPSTPLRVKLAVTGLVVLSLGILVAGIRLRLGERGIQRRATINILESAGLSDNRMNPPAGGGLAADEELSALTCRGSCGT